jgi:hypothetical protein
MDLASIVRPLLVPVVCVAVSFAGHSAALRVLRRAPPPPAGVAAALAVLAAPEKKADWGEVFLRNEAGDEATVGRALSRWAARRVDLAHIGQQTALSPRDRIRMLVTDMFDHDHLRDYIRDASRMQGFLRDTDTGGNCEAQTKLLVSAILAAEIKLDPEDSLGVQIFDDHLQAVIHNRLTGQVWVPLTGETQAQTRAPIYEPSVLLQAIVEGRSQGGEPVAGLPPGAGSAKVIAAPPGRSHAAPGRAGRGFSTDTRLTFPATGVTFAFGPVPERASLEPPPSEDEQIDAVVRETNVENRPLLAREEAIGYERCPALAVSLLRIRNEKDASYFNQLPTLETRASFLVELADKAMRQASIEPGADLVSLIEARDTGRLARHVGALSTVLGAVACTKEAIRALAVASSVYTRTPLQSDDRGPLAPFAAQVEALDRVAPARAEANALVAWIGRNPGRFAAHLSRLPHQLRAELLTLIPTDQASFVRTALPLLGAISISFDQRDVPDTIPAAPATTAWMTIELDSIDPVVQLPSGSPPPAPPPAASAPVADLVLPAAGERYPMPVDVFLDIAVFVISPNPAVFFGGFPGALRKKWNHRVQARFEERRASAPRRERSYFDTLATVATLTREE